MTGKTQASTADLDIAFARAVVCRILKRGYHVPKSEVARSLGSPESMVALQAAAALIGNAELVHEAGRFSGAKVPAQSALGVARRLDRRDLEFRHVLTPSRRASAGRRASPTALPA